MRPRSQWLEGFWARKQAAAPQARQRKGNEKENHSFSRGKQHFNTSVIFSVKNGRQKWSSNSCF